MLYRNLTPEKSLCLPIYLRPLILVLLIGLVPSLAVGQAAQKQLSKSEIAKQWKKLNWKFDTSWQPTDDPAAVKKWGEQIDELMQAKDAEALQSKFDLEPLYVRCVDGFTNEEFRKGFLDAHKPARRQLLQAYTTPGASYRFLGVRDSEVGPTALFRMNDPSGACNYHYWRLMKKSNGELVAVDLYVLLSAELLSETVRRVAIISAPKDERSLLEKLAGKEVTFSKNQVQLQKFLAAVARRNPQIVVENYENLPDELKSEKFVLLAMTTFSFQVDQDLYLKTLAQFRDLFPEDTAADLASMDLFFLKEKFDQMHKSLDRLDATIGEDAHLLTFRSAAFRGQKKFDDAKKAAREAMKLDPKHTPAYWNFVQMALETEDFDAVNETLKAMVKQFGFRQFNFDADPAYQQYKKSPQHDEFVEYLKTLK